MKTITLNVCQGVGDIFWVYQKFAPYVDKINFRITHVEGHDSMAIQNRSIPFLQLLPKVDQVTTWETTSAEYLRIAHSKFPMAPIMEQLDTGNTGSFDYACNKPLEEGIRIEDIDPEYPIEETVNIRMEPCPLAFDIDKYICVYVSGATKNLEIVKKVGIWPVEQWHKFIVSFYKKYKIKGVPIIIIGASYDKDTALKLHNYLKKSKFQVHTYIDSWSANITYILKHSLCFIGYQSGLNIIADNLDTKQVMLYFQHLKPMMYTWCKKKNWKSNIFNADLFSNSQTAILDNLKLKF